MVCWHLVGYDKWRGRLQRRRVRARTHGTGLPAQQRGADVGGAARLSL